MQLAEFVRRVFKAQSVSLNVCERKFQSHMDFPEVGTPPPHCNCNSITAFNLVLRKRQLDRLQSPIHHPCPSTHARQVGSIRGSCYSAVYTVYVEISVNAVNCLISNYCKNRGCGEYYHVICRTHDVTGSGHEDIFTSYLQLQKKLEFLQTCKQSKTGGGKSLGTRPVKQSEGKK